MTFGGMTVDFEDGQDINAVLDQIEKTCKKVDYEHIQSRNFEQKN